MALEDAQYSPVFAVTACPSKAAKFAPLLVTKYTLAEAEAKDAKTELVAEFPSPCAVYGPPWAPTPLQ
jgi:hypothetical protein